MKKATRLLILTAFVFPLLMVTRAYAGGPGPGHRIDLGQRGRIDLGSPLNQPVANPFELKDPIGLPGLEDNDRKDLWDHDFRGGRDPFLGDGSHPAGDPGMNSGSGGTAPIDGGLSLLLAAGLGLGIKKARARKEKV